MKTYINKDTLELFALVTEGSPQGLCMGVGSTCQGQHQILKSLGLVTELDKLEVTRLTDKGEQVARIFIDILRAL